jgi:hypothetical protein
MSETRLSGMNEVELANIEFHDRVETVESEIRADQVKQAIAEVNKVIDRMTELVVTPVIEKTVVDASKGGYEVHPESYTPLRMIVFVQSTGQHYELLKTGEATEWGTKNPPDYLEYWAIDCPHISWIGVKRAG